MAMEDDLRQRIHQRLVESSGREEADGLMEMLPPAGWGDIPTKHDLGTHIASVRADVDQRTAELRGALRTGLEAVRSHVDRSVAELRGEVLTSVADLRSEMIQQGSDLRAEMHESERRLRTEMGQLRGELRSEIGGVRGEIGGVRGEIGGVRGELVAVRDEVGALRNHTDDGFARITDRLDTLTYALVGAHVATFAAVVGQGVPALTPVALRVTVTDAVGDPVPGVAVTRCDDATCSAIATPQEGFGRPTSSSPSPPGDDPLGAHRPATEPCSFTISSSPARRGRPPAAQRGGNVPVRATNSADSLKPVITQPRVRPSNSLVTQYSSPGPSASRSSTLRYTSSTNWTSPRTP
jgi:hypothetical protein